MLLDANGLHISTFEPPLAAMLGNAPGEEGHKVLSEAISAGRSRVELRDWLYCLAKTPGTEIRRQWIDRPGKKPETFVALIEGAYDEETSAGALPDRLTLAVVASAVPRMLAAAEQLTSEFQRAKVGEAALTLALLETADSGLKGLLTAWATEDGLLRLVGYLRTKLAPATDAGLVVFTADGALNVRSFAPSGHKFCHRLVEDSASFGAPKITTRHMLYTLLGNESGTLATALTLGGAEVKRGLHANLSRELARPGAKRPDDFHLRRETVFDAVEQVLRQSHTLARQRGVAAIGEHDVACAFLDKQGRELQRLFPPDKPLDVAHLRTVMESIEPEEEETTNKRFTLKEIEEKVKQRIRGQNAAIDRVLPWIKRLRFGLRRDERPAAVFLFLGPTGTGKTQLAKELARYVFGDESRLIFLEMGQFKTRESMSGFIGAPPGYVGYGEGKLTNGLRDQPECVVLFDEIEKADTQVFDTLLRFADEGMISDPAGPVRDGRKCIIVMTTNAGQAWLRDHLIANPLAHDDVPTLTKRLFEEATKELQSRGFRPEFLGRIDERICFLPFTRAICREIIDDVLARELAKFEKQQVTIEITDSVRVCLAEKAYLRCTDEGARGAPRAVNEFIVTPAIDLLTSDATEQDETGPRHLIASLRGRSEVVLEVLP